MEDEIRKIKEAHAEDEGTYLNFHCLAAPYVFVIRRTFFEVLFVAAFAYRIPR